MIITKDMVNAVPHVNKDLWETPDPLYLKLNLEFGFTLDPCCTIESAKCEKFYTPVEDGLLKSWAGERVFMNPPYSRFNIDNWVLKMAQQNGALVRVALLPVSTSSTWYQDHICGKHEVRFINKRVRFKNAPFTAPFSSMIVIFNHNPIHTRFDQK